MVVRILASFVFILLAAGILGISILRTVTPQFAFSQAPNTKAFSQLVAGATSSVVTIEYELAHPGILPDHFLWPLKAARDQVWLFLTMDSLKRGEFLLLLADKRVSAAKNLMKEEKSGLAVSSSIKAERYLEQAVAQERVARKNGQDTSRFLDKLVPATLKHREVLEELYIMAPEDARPRVVEILNSPKKLFNDVKKTYIDLNKPIPQSPFLD